MKKAFILIILVLITFVSCDDYLEKYPLDKPSNATFYSTQDEIILAVNACYNYIAARVEWPSSSYPNMIWVHYYQGVNLTNSLLDNMNKAESKTNADLFKRYLYLMRMDSFFTNPVK